MTMTNDHDHFHINNAIRISNPAQEGNQVRIE